MEAIDDSIIRNYSSMLVPLYYFLIGKNYLSKKKKIFIGRVAIETNLLINEDSTNDACTEIHHYMVCWSFVLQWHDIVSGIYSW